MPIIMLDGSVADLSRITADDVDFAHVAASLSKVTRFNGRHRGQGFSVAQHSVMGADALFREFGDGILSGYFLLHDAHEFLLGDINRPVLLEMDRSVAAVLLARGLSEDLAAGAVVEAIRLARHRIDLAIHAAARLQPIERMPLYARQVAEMDERMCMVEARTLYGAQADIPLVRCDLPPPRLTVALRPWGAAKAEETFIERLERYLGIVVRAA